MLVNPNNVIAERIISDTAEAEPVKGLNFLSSGGAARNR